MTRTERWRSAQEWAKECDDGDDAIDHLMNATDPEDDHLSPYKKPSNP